MKLWVVEVGHKGQWWPLLGTASQTKSNATAYMRERRAAAKKSSSGFKYRVVPYVRRDER